MGNEVEASKYLTRAESVGAELHRGKWLFGVVKKIGYLGAEEKKRASRGSLIQRRQKNRCTNKQSQTSWVAHLNRCSSRSQQRL